MAQTLDHSSTMADTVTLFLCGDVMTGRGVDQILPFPSDPRLCEPFVTSAQGYVALAERAHGTIPKPVDFSYIWGDSLTELERARPDVRIVNLETSITRSDDCEPKGINYKMNPKNVPCLSAAKLDCCVLANNHVGDWGERSLLETLEALAKARIASAGAGRNAMEAEAPAILKVGDRARVLVFAFGLGSSGIPQDWAAGDNEPGINRIAEVSDQTLRRIASRVEDVKRTGDVVMASIHWGANWGYKVPREHRKLAHGLIDEAGVDVVHGHSSHHPKGIEVYKKKLILYGCGDFINDYEGIGGYESYRDDLVLMYLPSLEVASGDLVRLALTPLQISKFRLTRPARDDARWLRETLNRECGRFGSQILPNQDNSFSLRWT
jgi:poly-gamma-glutamate synthesis protein (capsule biosynthesis protein)